MHVKVFYFLLSDLSHDSEMSGEEIKLCSIMHLPENCFVVSSVVLNQSHMFICCVCTSACMCGMATP